MNGVPYTVSMEKRMPKTDEEWRRGLAPEQYRVMRERGTEPAFSGQYTYSEDTGVYRCAACGAELFSSEAKFDSGTGWPSFTQPVRSPAYYVYVLRMNNGQLYAGSTRNLTARVGAHRNGEVLTTRKYLPVALIHYEVFDSEKEAREREKILKYHGSAFAKLKARIMNNDEISLAGFTEPMNREHIELKEDLSHGLRRVEVVCKRCGSHLGHVFDDLPRRGKAGGPTERGGKRYCINSCALELEKADGGERA